MKFTVLQQDLLPVLQAVGRSVGVRSNLPVLDNILLSADNNELKLAATNLEIGIIKTVPVEVLDKGEITLPAKTLIDIVSSLGQREIEFEVEHDNVIVKSGKFSASINGIAASEFPAIPMAESRGVDFEKNVFLNCAQVLFACAVDEGRPALTGVLTESKAGVVDFVATDGFRLAHKKVELTKEQANFKSLIPKRTFEEVLRVIAEEQSDSLTVSTSESQNQIIFTIGKTILSSRLIEGKFPDWSRIIPTQIITKVTIEKDEALKAIKLASVFARNEASVLTFSIKKDSLILKSSTKELGSQENELEAQVEGMELEIAFNSRFLLDAISNCPAKQLLIEFSGPLLPTMVKPIGVTGLEYIVMPVKLN